GNMNFTEQFTARCAEVGSLVCVGLDSDQDKLPKEFRSSETAILDFNISIIDETAPYACAFKPNLAFYTAVGAEQQLEDTISYIHRSHPGIPVILDAKYGDIDNTGGKYAITAFERYKADAVTVSGYMGYDVAKPFLQYRDKGVIALCRTSNDS